MRSQSRREAPPVSYTGRHSPGDRPVLVCRKLIVKPPWWSRNQTRLRAFPMKKFRRTEKGKAEKHEPRRKTPTFLLELPLQVEAGQAKRVRAHLEVGRQFYNAVLSEGQRRLRQMRADPAWQAARAIPRARKQERRAAFSALREQHGFSENPLPQLAQGLGASRLAPHLDAVLAQTPARRAHRARTQVGVGKARRV